MNTLLLIFSIARILLKVAPELYTAFMEIMAVIKSSPAMGNETSASVVKSTARAIMPVLDRETAAEVQAALDDYDSGALAYRAQFANNP